MKTLGNIIWFLFSGLWTGLGWTLVGALWCITIIGIPVGLQCFKMAKLAIFPFGKKVVNRGGGGSMVLNIFWLIFGGVELALAHVTSGIALAVTIIGIPFAIQNFKLAGLALFPFGAEIVKGKGDDFTIEEA